MEGKLEDISQENGENIDRLRPTWRKLFALSIILSILVVIIAAAIIYFILLDTSLRSGKDQDRVNCSTWLIGMNFNSSCRIFKNAAVAVDSPFCSSIAKDVLLENGSPIDAAIAAGICNGVSNPHSMGIGGGHMMLIYLRNERKILAIDARNVAPIKATKDMFEDNYNLSIRGGLATAVPGEVAGYWLAHQLAGKLPWKRLFEPTINACRGGIAVSLSLATSLSKVKSYIRQNDVLTKMFINPKTNQTYKNNEKIKFLDLANTLEIIANKGAEAFYNGELSHVIIKENNLNGGILTLDDLKNYKPVIRTPIQVNFNDKYKIFVFPPPSSGVLVTFILNVMDTFNLTENTIKCFKDNVLFHHRLIEAFKHAYAKRSYLGDPGFVNISEALKNLTSPAYIDEIRKLIDDETTFPESFYNPAWNIQNDHGTGHISVLAENGDAVSLTSTINTLYYTRSDSIRNLILNQRHYFILSFGGLYAGATTGIIYNNEMNDFSIPNSVNKFFLPASPYNFIEPGKRPMSSMSPLIVLDNNDDVKLIIGGTGGTMITSAVATVVLKTLWLNESLKEAIDQPRLHHQLFPNYIFFESEYQERIFPQKKLLKYLQRKNHEIKCSTYSPSVIETVMRDQNGDIVACSDFRKRGDVDGY